jgi:exopolysaccharide biosynthesis polyprenyl glycosylphosphotransferase
LAFVSLGRFLVRRTQRFALRQGYGIYRVLLVGNGRYGTQLAEALRQVPEVGFRVVGELPDVDVPAMKEFVTHGGVDELIQTNPALTDEKNLQLLDFCDQYKIDYKYVPNLFETQVTNVRFRLLHGVPMVELLRTPLEGWGRIVKRGMDLAVSGLGLLLLSPFFLLLGIIIKLDSPGPVFYHQARIGRNKKPFQIYKFRSMKLEYCTGLGYGGEQAEAFEAMLRQQTNERSDGPLFKMKDDPRLTKSGRFIRKWRIDELPQLFNVLGGSMSLLGPRPHLAKEVEHYTKHHRKLFTIKPGMSGMAQVQGSSGLSFEEEAKLDIGYIENWSLKTDVVLLARTLSILLGDPNAV